MSQEVEVAQGALSNAVLEQHMALQHHVKPFANGDSVLRKVELVGEGLDTDVVLNADIALESDVDLDANIGLDDSSDAI